jgi:hypothetical protein
VFATPLVKLDGNVPDPQPYLLLITCIGHISVSVQTHQMNECFSPVIIRCRKGSSIQVPSGFSGATAGNL